MLRSPQSPLTGIVRRPPLKTWLFRSTFTVGPSPPSLRNPPSNALIGISIPQVAMLALPVSSPSRHFQGQGRISHLTHLSRAVAGNQVYDWLILLDREVEHIWRQNWSVGKILFIIARYGPLLDLSTIAASESDPCTVGIGETLTSDSGICSTHRPARLNRQ